MPPRGNDDVELAGLDALLTELHGAATACATAAPAQRQAFVLRLVDRLAGQREAIVDVAQRETLLSRLDLERELDRATVQLTFIADLLGSDEWIESQFDRVQVPSATTLRRLLVPLGPVLVFESSNFPFLFGAIGNDVVSAIATGNSVVLKVHECHPHTTLALISLVQEALSAVNLATATLCTVRSKRAAVAVLGDSRVHAAGFTGSLNGGRYLRDIASSRSVPIPFYGEFGSLNPCVVTKSALRERRSDLLAEFVQQVTLRSGQLCTKPGLLLVAGGSDSAEEIGELLRPLTELPMLSTEIADQFRSRLDRQEATDGSLALSNVLADSGRPRYVRPTVIYTTLENVLDHDVLREECFGPSSVVAEFDSVADVIAAFDDFQGSLTGALMTGSEEDPSDHERLLSALVRMSGRVILNGWPTGVAVARAMQHGGPWPSSSEPASTSIGGASLRRWMRPVALQGFNGFDEPSPIVASGTFALGLQSSSSSSSKSSS